MCEIENEMLVLGVYALVVRGQGEDLLMGKNVHDFIPVTGLEELLHLFICDLDEDFKFIYDNDINGYLEAIVRRFHMNLSELSENLMANIEQMRTVDSDEIMIYYLVITKTLETLRQLIYATKGWAWIAEMYRKKHQKDMSLEIRGKIEQCDNEDDKDLSILYNLVFIHYLAQIYEQSGIEKVIRRIIEEKLRHFFENF